jgi:hypothetical protein
MATAMGQPGATPASLQPAAATWVHGQARSGIADSQATWRDQGVRLGDALDEPGWAELLILLAGGCDAVLIADGDDGYCGADVGWCELAGEDQEFWGEVGADRPCREPFGVEGLDDRLYGDHLAICLPRWWP